MVYSPAIHYDPSYKSSSNTDITSRLVSHNYLQRGSHITSYSNQRGHGEGGKLQQPPSLNSTWERTVAKGPLERKAVVLWLSSKPRVCGLVLLSNTPDESERGDELDDLSLNENMDPSIENL
jgi:hypothetical protein